MSTFLALLKVSLNVNFGLSALKYRLTREKKHIWKSVIIGVAAVVGIFSIVTLLTFFMLGIFIGASSPQVNRPELVITIAFVTSQMMVLVFGIFYILSAFYFSNDLSILIPLPLKPSHILGSKLIIVIINEYMIVLPILLPSLIIYGVGTRKGLAYWLKSLILMLSSPAIPLVLGGLLVVVLMRFVNLRRNKDLFTIIGGFFALFFAVGINVLTQSVPKTGQEEYFKNFLVQQSGLVEQIGRKFPPSIWATYGLAKHGLLGWAYFILFISVSILLYILLMWIGDRFFYKSVLAGQEAVRKRKVVSEEELGAKYKKTSSPVVSLLRREWKVFLRTPIYAMNGFMGMIIAPFLLMMPFILQREQMGDLFMLINNASNIVIMTLVATAVGFFTSNLNIIACTAISREGHTFWISKMIPVSAKEQVMAKFIHALFTGVIGLVITVLVIGTLFRFPLWAYIVVFILTFLGNIFITALNLIIDILRPKLEWTNPQEAVKQNLNGFLGILVTFLCVGILAAAAFGLVLAGLPGWFIYLCMAILMVILAVPSIWGMLELAEYKYGKIEA